MCCLQRERDQREGLGNGVYISLNPCPETITSGKYFRLCHWESLLVNKPVIGSTRSTSPGILAGRLCDMVLVRINHY